jgi:hypothetical protein
VNIFFDVDFTLITWDNRLRPHVHDVFQQFIDDGHTVYLWSGMGERWEVVRENGLDELVAGCFEKPLYRHVERLEAMGVTVWPDFVIDDYPEPVEVFGGVQVTPPVSPLTNDREMWRVYEEFQAFFERHPEGRRHEIDTRGTSGEGLRESRAHS